ncbi:MAG: 3-deoxy-8-phosphooctulonate synthase [Spirochaetia bacterium]|nr:3-deoxy-8-phosphooctulonate synthase [Spirochaetia bacterium]
MIPLTIEATLPGNIPIGGKNPFFLIAGPCVIESEKLLEETAEFLTRLQKNLNIGIILKSSYDKANRSSALSFRGPGIDAGLAMLKNIKTKYGFPIITDVHSPEEAEKAGEVCDLLQIPAFLCRQTDLIQAAAKTGKWTNIKKGQFLAPTDVMQVVDKFTRTGSDKFLICERGYTFGYNNLVVDMRSLELMRKEGIRVVIDITHSTQLPGGGLQTGGQREMSFPIGRAAVAVGVEGIFLEIHPNPVNAMSDSTTQLSYEDAEKLIYSLYKIDRVVKE